MASMSHARSPSDDNDRRSAWIVAVLSFLIFLPGSFWGLPAGKTMIGGMLVADGAVPYRDFWTMYAPGMYWLTGAIFRLFGVEALYQATVACALNGGIMGMLYLLARRVEASRRVALAIAAVVLVSFWGPAPKIFGYPPALLLLLGALFIVVRYHQEGGVARLFRAGLCIGLAAVFKHDISFYILLAVTLSLFVVPWLLADRKVQGTGRPFAAALRLIAGVVLVFLPVAIWVAWVAGADAWQDLFVFPATDFKGVRGEPYARFRPVVSVVLAWLRNPTSLNAGRDAGDAFSGWMLCHLPELVFVTAGAAIVRARRRIAAAAMGPAVTFLLALPLFYMAAHVQRNTHLYSMAILSLLLGAMAWRHRRARPVLLAGGVTYAVALAVPALMLVFLVLVEWQGSRVLDLPGVRGVRVSAREYGNYLPIATWLRENTAPDERIYVGVERHDAIVIPAMKFHYLAGRRSATRYHELHPGVTDRLEIQREMIADIERHEVRAVVIWKFGWPQERLDAIKARRMAQVEGIGSTYLDEWIAENFEPIVQYGEYVLMWRKGVERP